MAMLGLLSDDYGLWPELEPRLPPTGWPLPHEADMAQVARDEAARRFPTGRRVGPGARTVESLSPQPPDAALLGMLNPPAPAAAAAPVSAGAPAAPASFPSPVEAATPNFDLTPTRPVNPASMFPPVQGLDDTRSAPAVPSWLGMLNSAPMPRGMDASGYPVPDPAPASRSDVAPTPAASAPPAPSPASVPETSLMGRFGDFLSKANDWRENNRLTLMALGAGMAGAQSLGQGLNRGMTMALPAMQQDIAQQHQNQTVAALMKRGIPQDVALAAAGNPAVMQQIIGQVFGPKAYQHVTVKDRLGNEIPLVFDPASGKYVTQNISGAGATSLSAGDPSKTGEEYLKSLDPLTQSEVKAFAEGRAPVTARNLQTMLPMVTQYDPSFQASDYPIRLAARKNYTSGKQFQEIQAINTVAGHLDDLRNAADELQNTRFPWWNAIANTALQQTGDARVDKFNTVRQAVTNELSKAYRAGQVTEGDVREWQENISTAKSPEQLRAVIGKMNDLLASKRQALEDGYRSSMGPAPLPSEFKATSDRAAAVFNRVADWAHGVKPAGGTAAPAAPAPAAAAPAQAGVPAPGHYQWTPDRGLILVQ